MHAILAWAVSGRKTTPGVMHEPRISSSEFSPPLYTSSAIATPDGSTNKHWRTLTMRKRHWEAESCLGNSVDWECLWLKGQHTGTRFDTFLFPAEWLETRSEKLKRQSSYSSRGQQRYTLWWTWYVLLIIACAGVSPVLANLVHCNAIRTFYCVCHHTRVVYKQCYVHCLKGDG